MSYDSLKWGVNDLKRMRRTRLPVWMLGLAIAAALLLAILAPFDRFADPRDFVNVLVVAPLLIIGLARSPFARDALVGSMAKADYDEFETIAVLRARSHAYGVLTALVVLLVLWCWLGSLAGIPYPSRPYDWSAFIMAVPFVAVALPVLIAELSVPMPPQPAAEDEEDTP